MNTLRAFSLWGTIALGVLVSSPSLYAKNACTALFSLPASQELPSSLRIATYNLDHLVVSTLPEHIEKSKKLKTVLNDINADVLVLTEIVDVVALQQIVSRLDNGYKKFFIEGNDLKGGHIAVLLREDLPVEASYESHRSFKWHDPITNHTHPVFLRDAPALILKKTGASIPFLIVVGVHSKSQRDRVGDPRSEIQRTAEFKAYLSIAENYKRMYHGKVPVIVAGDFNTDVTHSREFAVLKKEFQSAFDVAIDTTTFLNRVTHTYHSNPRFPDFHQIDDILIPPSLRHFILKATVHRYKDIFGNPLPFAETLEARNKQPSDHLPIFVEISTEAF